MQKKIIALAVAGLMSGAAFAQSNVTIYGRIDVGYLNGDTSLKNAAGVKSNSDIQSTGFSSGALTTNRIGFKGTEDLGNGLKANFNLEYALNNTHKIGADTGTDLAAPFATRLATVGLSSASWGSFDLGRQLAAVETAWAMGSAGAQNNAVGSLYGDTRLTDPRVDEALTYTSPMMSGFQAKVQYSKGSTDPSGAGIAAAAAFGQNEHTRWGAAASYGNGPLNVSLGYSRESTDIVGATAAAATGLDLSQWTLAGNYNFGIAKVFGIYTRGSSEGGYANANLGINTAAAAAAGTAFATTADGEIDRRSGWELGVNVPVGPVVLIASYYRAKTDFDNLAGATDADHDGYQLAALYPLSKRTMLYGMYGSTDTDHSRNARTFSVDQYAVGLRHDF
jgi:GBP family porin